MSTEGSAKTFTKYAWREIPREDLPQRQAGERITDSLEIYGLFDEQIAREQANRCIQCPNPGCVGGCPLCNPIPQWMSLTAEGRFVEAAATLGSLTNMADICARLCPRERLCEDSCILNGSSQPVAIAAIEQFLADYALQNGLAEIASVPPNGRRVAVVGCSPGGLACADYLAKLGFSVTVFEIASEPGGSLLANVPGFKLEKAVVERRIRILETLGVRFQVDAVPGGNLALGELRSDFDAVYLCFESRVPRVFKVPGAELKHVIPAGEFIRLCNGPRRDQVRGKKVVVIGGGESAMDASRTALRGGAGEVTCVYRRDQGQIPCAGHDVDAAREEGARFVFGAAPVAILPDQAGGVKAVRFSRTEPGPLDASGRPSFVLVPDSEFEMPVDVVVPAIGYEPGTTHLPGDFADLAMNPRGTLVVDFNQMTSEPNVYAGGDLVQGPCMALLAVRDARRAAAAIQAKLAISPTTR